MDVGGDANASPDQSVAESGSDTRPASDAPPGVMVDATLDADAKAADAADASDATQPTDAADADVTTEMTDVGDASDASDEANDGGEAGDADSAVEASCSDIREDCTNGIDDNCDGLIDCADPECRPGYACVPDWGTGWANAPVALYDVTLEGGPAPQGVACPSAYPLDVFDGHNSVIADETTCSCSCGPVEDAGCSGPLVAVYVSGGAVCSNQKGSGVLAADGGCTSIPASQGGLGGGAILDGGAVIGGSCKPNVTTNKPPWDPAAGWENTGQACALSRPYSSGPDGGCDAGYICVPVPPQPFLHGVCVVSTGMATCPDQYDASTYYTGGTDGRGCTNGCSCGAPTELSCTPSVTLYSGESCDSGTTNLATPACSPLFNLSPSNGFVSGKITPGTTPGQCAPSQATIPPTGSVQPTGLTTVCCTTALQ